MSYARGVRKGPMPWPAAVFLILACLGLAYLGIGYPLHLY